MGVIVGVIQRNFTQFCKTLILKSPVNQAFLPNCLDLFYPVRLPYRVPENPPILGVFSMSGCKLGVIDFLLLHNAVIVQHGLMGFSIFILKPCFCHFCKEFRCVHLILFCHLAEIAIQRIHDDPEFQRIA